MRFASLCSLLLLLLEILGCGSAGLRSSDLQSTMSSYIAVTLAPVQDISPAQIVARAVSSHPIAEWRMFVDSKLILKKVTAKSTLMQSVPLSSGPHQITAAATNSAGMSSSASVAVVVPGASAGVTMPQPQPTHPASPMSPQILLGASDPIDVPYLTSVKAQEVWLGNRYAIVEIPSSNWCDKNLPTLFGRLTDIWSNKSVPSLSWTSSENCISYRQSRKDQDSWIASGNMDAYLSSFSEQLKAWLSGPDGLYGTGDDRRIYIRFDQEMNGNWFPWSATGVGKNTTADFVNMWRHVWTMVMTRGGLDAKHVQWLWCVYNIDVGGIKMEEYYPGAAYVDWVASDGYNGFSNSWLLPSIVFRSMFSRLHVLAPDKPLAIPEVGTAANTSTGAKCSLKDSIQCKTEWLTELYAKYLPATMVKMVVYYNHFDSSTSKSHDWTYFAPLSAGKGGDTESTIGGIRYRYYSTYKTAVSRRTYASTDPGNPRLLTNEQFEGHF